MNQPSFNSHNRKKNRLLLDRLIQSVKQNKTIGFDEFLEIVLYDSEYGYYRNSNAIFGEQGDFVTAPTRSSLFSMTIARQCMQVLGGISKGNIIEFGPGNGELAKDVLLYLKKYSALPDHYYLVETSSTLQQRQKKLLEEFIPDYLPNIHWVNQQQLMDFTGVVIANEMVDALPFKRIQFNDEKIYELKVAHEDDSFVWTKLNIDSEIEKYIEKYIPNDVLNRRNFQTEIHLEYEPFLKQLSQTMKQGVLLIMDYGSIQKDYYAYDKSNGSMRCFFEHTVHDNPFVNIGLQDITCDVEFSALTNLAFENKFDILGYTTQANFLIGNDIQSIYNERLLNSEAAEIELNSEFKSLVMPDEMGERFKVLALGKNYKHSLAGFSFKDLKYTL